MDSKETERIFPKTILQITKKSKLLDQPYFDNQVAASINGKIDDDEEKLICEPLDGDMTIDSSSSESDHWVDPKVLSTPPAEYWHVQKLVKYIKLSNFFIFCK